MTRPLSPRLRDLGLGALLFVATALAYLPAIRGGFVWNDSDYVTRPDLRSLEGLRRIWFEVGSTEQYYPLLHSAFWVEHRLWGDDPAGYHLANVALHALAAVLLVGVLRRLSVPGAWLAGFAFALHPVCVESVAWISEQKNTLSTVFFMASLAAYLSFDGSRRGRSYVLALAWFALALASKTVTATLPAVLLVLFWWKRGRLSFARDVRPLLPFFAMGIAGGFFSAWVEKTYIGAEGEGFGLVPIERLLVAGRAFWFYLGKAFWPHPLIFIYPRWRVSASSPAQYLYPLAAAALVALLWALRGRTRAPLAAVLLFGGALVPVMGFLNVYAFIFSYVADHWEYLALPAALAAGCAVLSLARGRGAWLRWAAIGLLPVFAVLTWRQSRMYRDLVTFYQTTIDRNPECWMALNNLGAIDLDAGRLPEARERTLAALRLRPRYPEALANLSDIELRLGRPEDALRDAEAAERLSPTYVDGRNALGMALAAKGRPAEAVSQYEEALRLRPGYAQVRNNLAVTLLALGRPAEAVDHLERARALQPGPEVDSNLGLALTRAGQPERAVPVIEEALRRKPDFAEAEFNLGNALDALGRLPEAIEHYGQAVRLQPRFAEAESNLGNALARSGHLSEAIGHYRAALAAKPELVQARGNLGIALASTGNLEAAAAELAEALRLEPSMPELQNNLGAVLAALGRRPEAISHYEAALRLRPDYADAHNNLGVALAASGRWDEAISHYRLAIGAHPADRKTHENLAAALRAMGRRDEGEREAQEAARLAAPQGSAP